MNAVPPPTPAAVPEVGARRSLRRRLAGGPIARAIARVDVRLYRFAHGRALPPPVARGVVHYSRAGESAAMWLALGACGAAVDRTNRPRWLRGAATVAVAFGLNTALKYALRRRRPAFEDLPALVKTPTTMSFPSAHATSSFAAARAYTGLVPAVPLYGLAAAMAASRVVVGVHYPSDVCAGAMLGVALGSAAR